MHEAEISRNRRRIAVVAVLGLLNYWVSAIAFTAAVIVGTIGALVIEGLFEAFDLDLAMAVIRWVPKVLAAIGPAMGLVIVVVGSIVAVALMVGRLAGVEKQVVRETGSRLLPPEEEGRPGEVLAGLAIASGLPRPRVAAVDAAALNSFVVGRRPGRVVIGLTRGLVEQLSRDELEAVLAYQLSRVASSDVALSTWTVALTGRTIELLERTERLLVMVVLFVPARLARRLRATALRGQTAQRDLIAIRFTRHPAALLSALERLAADPSVVDGVSDATAPLWIEHPRDPSSAGPLRERIEAIRPMVGEPG